MHVHDLMEPGVRTRSRPCALFPLPCQKRENESQPGSDVQKTSPESSVLPFLVVRPSMMRLRGDGPLERGMTMTATAFSVGGLGLKRPVLFWSHPWPFIAPYSSAS